MNKFTVEVRSLSMNGFKDTIIFDDLTHEETIEVQKFFNKYYDYVCEYHIKKYIEVV